MPRRNRVNPFGQLCAVTSRGDLMGNRGRLHDATGEVRRDYGPYRGWIACTLDQPGMRRTIMAQNSYTELFFRDEATALAAGHRPCAQCRRADAVAFKQAWRRAWPQRGFLAADLNDYIYPEQITAPITKFDVADDLPDGTMIGRSNGSAAWLRWRGRYQLWSFEGYRAPEAEPDGDCVVLTRPSILAVLKAGYPVGVHESAQFS